MDKLVNCICERWSENKPIINSALLMASLRGMQELKDIFVFCPWCGKRLEISDNV